MVGTFAADDVAITFERLGRQHFDLLGRWLAEPHVARWWNHDPSHEILRIDRPIAAPDAPVTPGSQSESVRGVTGGPERDGGWLPFAP